MSAAIAARVYGSEVLVALVRHYRMNPGPQKSAAAALDLPQQLVSKQTRILIEAGVVVVEAASADDGRARHCTVDEKRAKELLRALQDYLGV